jgi:hypothetical protein
MERFEATEWKGEFLNGVEGEKILTIADSESFDFADVDNLGLIIEMTPMDIHYRWSVKTRISWCWLKSNQI